MNHSNDSNEEYIDQWYRYRATGCTAARDYLINHFSTMAIRVAGSLKPFDADLESEAIFLLITLLDRARIAVTDDNVKGYLFAVLRLDLIKYIIESQVIRVPNDSKRRHNISIFYHDIENSDLESSDFTKISDLMDAVYRCCYSEIERDIVTYRISRYTDFEIALKLEVSQPTVSRIRATIYERYQDQEA